MSKRCVKTVSAAVLLATGLLVSGCAFERDPSVLQDPLYKAGRSDGCTSGHTRVSGFKDTIHRNADLYAEQENYRAGWGDGYSACGGQSGFDDNSVFNQGTSSSDIRY